MAELRRRQAGQPVDQPIVRPRTTTSHALQQLAALCHRLNGDERYDATYTAARAQVGVALVLQPQTRDVITSRPNPDHHGRLWFWTSWNHPIAPIDDIDAALTEIGTYLVVRL